MLLVVFIGLYKRPIVNRRPLSRVQLAETGGELGLKLRDNNLVSRLKELTLWERRRKVFIIRPSVQSWQLQKRFILIPSMRSINEPLPQTISFTKTSSAQKYHCKLNIHVFKRSGYKMACLTRLCRFSGRLIHKFTFLYFGRPTSIKQHYHTSK